MKNFLINSVLILIVLFTFFNQTTFGQWVQASNGIATNNSIYSFTARSGNIFTGTFNTGVYATSNIGSNWEQTSLNNKTVFSLLNSGNNVVAGTSLSGVYYSANNGVNWTQTTLNDKIVFSLAGSGNNVFAGVSGSGVYLSTNNGINWSQTSLNNLTIYSLAISGSSIFAGTASGVYLSTNNGSNWTLTAHIATTVYALLVSGTSVFSGTSTGVYISTNNGSTWTQTALSQPIRSLTADGNNIFAGTNSNTGVYYTNNNGTSWIQKNQGFTSLTTINALFIDNNFIFAGTQGQSVWKRSLTEIIGIRNISSEIPSAFSLEQNYPNPFNPETKIKFSVSKSGGVKITVYDMIGREVQELVNESLKPGIYETTFNGAILNSGVYLYKITAGEFSETKRMLLIK